MDIRTRPVSLSARSRLHPRPKPVLTLSASLILGASSAAALANDTDLTYGGAPKALNGNTTVAMEREYVKIVVGESMVDVDCRFRFENRGPAQKLRIGFPDDGGDAEINIDPHTGKRIPAEPSIRDFRSWVNGKLVKTSAVPAQLGSFWHVKRVEIPRNGAIDVRDHYSVPVGSSVAYWPHAVSMAEYVLQTGASWRGNIRRSEVEVRFTGKRVTGPIAPKSLPNEDDTARREALIRNMSTDRRTVYYHGPCAPTVSDKTLRFVRTNWRPGRKDDILLIFAVK